MTSKVFISHTSEFAKFPDGQSFVDAALEAVAQVGLLPENMRMFTSVPCPAASLCIERVQACDIFVLLAGFRYGSPVRENPGVSYVQLEYETALKLNLPVLVFMLSDEATSLPGKMFIDSEYGQRQVEFRNEMLRSSRFTCVFFKSRDELRRVLEQALVEYKSSIPATDISSDPPRQVRTRPLENQQNSGMSLTGRKKELSRMEDSIRKTVQQGTSFGFHGLRGMGGVGKSALAAELAERLSSDVDLVPGGVLWTNLLEETPEDAARRWLRSYYVDCEDVQATEAIERLHQLAGERKPLIVLDNAQSREQVKKLLVLRAGVVNLVTTRELQNLPPEIDTQVVEGLSPADALKFLGVFARDLVTEELDSAKQICTQCGYLPIFLRVAGAAIKSGEYDQLSDYAAELSERGLTGLADHDLQAGKVFELSWEKLNPLEQEIFSVGSLFPGEDFGSNFVQTYLGTEQREARKVLTRLENASLLFKAENRYRYHDRVREFAHGKLLQTTQTVLEKIKSCWTDWHMVEAELKQKGAFELSRQYFQLGKDDVTKPADFGPWYHFARSYTHTFSRSPELFFQQAFNEPHDSPVAAAAASRIRTATVSSGWLEWLNRPQEFLPPSSLQLLAGHQHFVNAVKFHPDGKRVLSGSADGMLRLWNLETGECVAVFEGHEDIVTSVVFVANGELAVSASFDGTLRIWNVEKGTCENVLHGHTTRVNDIAMCGDSRIASASHDHTVRVWCLVKGACEAVLRGHTNWVTAVACAPRKQLILSGSWDRTLKVWDLEKQTCRSTMSGHSSGIECVAVHMDENQIASGARDGKIRVWNSGQMEPVAFLDGHSHGVRGLAYCNDGKRIVSASWDKTLRLWNVEAAKTVAVFEGHTQRVEGVSISKDDRFAVSCSRDKTIREWDLDSRRDEQELDKSGHAMRVSCVRISRNQRLAVSGSDDATIRIWDIDSGQSSNVLTGHSRGVTSIALSDSMDLIASGSKDLTVRVWRRHDQCCLNTLTAYGTVLCLEFVGSDFVICGTVDATLRLWDCNTGRSVAVFEGHEDAVEKLAVSHNGSQVVSTSRDGITKLWDIESKRCVDTLDPGSPKLLETLNCIKPFRTKLSIDGFRIVSGLNDEFVAEYPGHFENAACSIDGQLAATGNNRGQVSFYKLRS